MNLNNIAGMEEREVSYPFFSFLFISFSILSCRLISQYLINISYISLSHIITLHCAQLCDLFDTLRKNTSLTKLSVVNCQVGKLKSSLVRSISGSFLLSYTTPDQIYIAAEEIAHIIVCISVVSVVVFFPTLNF